MNDEAARQGRHATNHYTRSKDSAGGMRTPLQIWTGALFDLLEDASSALGEGTWASFVAIGCERIGIEAARLAVAEAIRATRDGA